MKNIGSKISSRIPGLSRDDECGTSLPEHPPQVVDQQFGLLVRRKVPAAIMLRFEHDIAQ
jgi:hypothetical protein